MRVKRIASIIVIAGLCMNLMGCGNAAQEEKQMEMSDENVVQTENNEKLRVAWWGSQERHNATIEVLDKYAEENGIEFSYEYTSWTSYFENLATQAVGNNLPDIIQMSAQDIVNYTQNGQLIDLQEYIDNGSIDTSSIDKNSLNGGIVNEKLTGVTTGVNTAAVIYNKDIFDQANVSYPQDDWTWTEFLTTAKSIYDATGIPTEIPFLSEARWAVDSMVRSYGYTFFQREDGKLAWADDEKVTDGVSKTIDAIYGGVKEGYLVDPEVQVAWSTTEDTYIAQGKSAMSMILSNYYVAYCQALGQELGLAMLPQMDDASQNGMYLNPNMYWSISANCENVDAAIKVINYLINDPEVAKVIGVDRGVSLSSTIRNDFINSEDTDPYIRSSIDYINRVSDVVSMTNTPDPINATEATNVLKTDYVAVMYGEMSAKDCIQDFVTQTQNILN